jgi:CPA1 family monovalent cation:H+ antiporter
MDSFEIFILLVFCASLLVGMAQKVEIPYPIALVIGGTAIGFVPRLQAISFDPNLILVMILPPILYYAAFSISFLEFKKNWREIFSLALGLVLLTTCVVAIIFKWLFPEFPWALAFAFGAIVSPPDSVATTTIMKRFSISPRLLTIVEGESLINDASALVLYKLAVAAILSGVFSLAEATQDFVMTVSGGVIVGIVFGLFVQHLSRKFLDPVSGVVFSFTIPYVTYILAAALEVSGVLAVVVNGLIAARVVAKHRSSLRRVLGFAWWDILVILVNCLVFILIGLQLRRFTTVMTAHQIILYSLYGLMVTMALIVVRLIWVYSKNGIAYLRAFANPKTVYLCPQILREAAIIGWSGMRGIVSLAAALALPYTFPDGTPIAGRDEVIFITFVVILITLLLPSSTLPYLLRLLKLEQHVDHYGVHQARKYLAEVASSKIAHLRKDNKITEREGDFLSNYFNVMRYIFEIADAPLKKMSNLEKARLKVFEAQRNALLQLWEKQEIDDRLFRQLEHELDVEESHVARVELK